jgi:hypothetical protein
MPFEECPTVHPQRLRCCCEWSSYLHPNWSHHQASLHQDNAVLFEITFGITDQKLFQEGSSQSSCWIGNKMHQRIHLHPQVIILNLSVFHPSHSTTSVYYCSLSPTMSMNTMTTQQLIHPSFVSPSMPSHLLLQRQRSKPLVRLPVVNSINY